MDKTNNDSKKTINDRVAIFQVRNNNQINSEKSKKTEEKKAKEKNNQPNDEKQNIIKHDKTEEKKKESNNPTNIIKEINKKEALKTETKVENKKGNQLIKNNSLKENITPSGADKDKKEKKENDNKKNETNDLNLNKGKSNEKFLTTRNVFETNTKKEDNKNNNSLNDLKNKINADKIGSGEIRTTSTVMIRSNLKIDKINENKVTKEKADKAKNKAVSNKNNNIQQKKNLEKKNTDNKNKPKEIRNHIDQSILERLKIFYNPEKSTNIPSNNIAKDVNKEKAEINNNSNDKKNENNNNINDENKTEKITPKEKELSTVQLASMKIAMHFNEIRNYNKNDASSFQKIPKKLNIKEYLQKLKIEEISSKIKADKREEIKKLSQKKKEEEKLNSINEAEQESEMDKEQEIEKEQQREKEKKLQQEKEQEKVGEVKDNEQLQQEGKEGRKEQEQEEEKEQEKEQEQQEEKEQEKEEQEEEKEEKKEQEQEEKEQEKEEQEEEEEKEEKKEQELEENKEQEKEQEKEQNSNYNGFTILSFEEKDNSLNNSIQKEERDMKKEFNDKKGKNKIKKKASIYQRLKDKICHSLFKKSESAKMSGKNVSSSNANNINENGENENQEDEKLNMSDNYGSFSNSDIEYINVRNNSTVNEYKIPKYIKSKDSNKNDLSFNRDSKIEKAPGRNTLQFSKSSNQFTNQKKFENPKEEIFLEMMKVSKTESKSETKAQSDKFCESFFIASFPTENGKIVENTEYDSSDCGHKDCFLLPAMQPEIIYKYPKEDTKGLELNNLAASICFPNGIKICYEENEVNVKTVKNYRSSFTSQVGDMFFALTYHFYYKMLNLDFATIYKMNPIRYQLTTYTDELTTTFNDELFEDTKEKFNYYTNLNFRENVYIPFCLCLVSKYPFYEQMEKCLESIMISLINAKTTIEELHRLITYIVESIPAPPKQSKISFALPYIKKICEIQYPYFENILQIGDNPIMILKNNFSISLIIYVFKLLILEQKILVVGKDNDTVSQFILNFVSLLYPFEWIHTFIPLMSEKMLKFLQSFLPFFNGMNISLYEKAKPILAKASKGVFIINIDEKTIEINTNLRENKKFTKASNYIDKFLDSLPRNIEHLLYRELKSIKMEYDNTQNHYNNCTLVNMKIKHLFLHVFAKLIYDYKKYSHIIDGYPVFNSFLMIKEKKDDKSFYQQLLQTQLFQMFIQNSFDDTEKSFYFDEYIKEYNELKKEGHSSNTVFYQQSMIFFDQYTSFLDVNKNYIIKPYFFKGFDEFEKKNEKKNVKFKLRELYTFISEQTIPNVLKKNIYNGILKENIRFVDHQIELKNEDDPTNYVKFIIPEQKIENKETKIKEVKENDTTTQASLDKTFTIKRGLTKVRIISGEDTKKYSIYKRNKGELTEDEMDDIKDTVREVMTRVYRSELKNVEEDRKKILDVFTQTKFGRDHFVNVISSGNKKERVIKILQRDSFDFMDYVIFNSLLTIVLDQTEENIKCALNLLKTCLYIKTIDNKKELLLSDVLFPRLDSYSLFTEIDFWKKWIEDDMTESDLEVLKSKKEKCVDINSDNYQKYLEHSYDIMDRLSRTMMKMRLKCDFIYLNFSELCIEYIIDKDSFDKLLPEFIDQLYYYKVLTNQK